MGYTLILILGVTISLGLTLWLLTFHPQTPLQKEVVNCNDKAPLLQPGQSLKVLSWNVQFMAGKDYVFFYDQPDGSGPDTRPSAAHITHTINAAADLINTANPDILLLQEIDVGAKRTDYQDQGARLQALLEQDYPCQAGTYYWKSTFIPHPKIMGAVGLKLVTLSKYHIASAQRHALPQIPGNPIYKLFNLKRAHLECRLPLSTGSTLALFNTHLDAFGQGTNIMARQIRSTTNLLDSLAAQGVPWLMGGDFNLLPPGINRHELHSDERYLYNDQTEIQPLFDKFHSVIPLEVLTGPERHRYFTHHPNTHQARPADRTIDYIFYDGLEVQHASILQQEALGISDHFPIISYFQVPE